MLFISCTMYFVILAKYAFWLSLLIFCKITPESITVTKILRQAGPEFTTSTGELLFHIMSSGYANFETKLTHLRAFQEAFPDASAQLRTRLAEKKLEDEDVAPPNKMDTATLFTKEGQLCLPCVCTDKRQS